jgi:hypothetical protein
MAQACLILMFGRLRKIAVRSSPRTLKLQNRGHNAHFSNCSRVRTIFTSMWSLVFSINLPKQVLQKSCEGR